MRLSQFTSVGRPIDPSYATNRAIAILVVVALVGTGVLSDWATGLRVALSVFFAWALGRELDPDYDLSAFLGVGLAVAGMSRWGVPPPGPLFLLLLGIRAVNRTTGLRPTPVDWLVLLALAWSYLGSGWPGGFSWQPAGLALAMALSFFPVWRDCHHMISLTDETAETLSSRRVRAGQLLSLSAGVLAAGFQGWTGLASLLAFWAAVLGSTMVHAFDLRAAGQKVVNPSPSPSP